MKKKLLVFLSIAMLTYSAAGCNKDSQTESPDSMVSEIAETTEIITTPTTTYENTDDTTDPAAESQSDFDFNEAIEQTYLCGQQLSYPLTWGQLGEDFSVGSEAEHTSFNYMYCYLNYKGQYLGVITFKYCMSVSQITENTTIADIYITDSTMEEFEIPTISVKGVMLHDNRETLYEALGDGCEISKYTGDASYPDIKTMRKFCFSLGAEDEITGVDIQFC
ncbi:MAG: hypothetical protein J6K77_05535 [Ruminococcus sp.]|nr:hypothetical protein [Ruminococcus sp.]